jgi:hypothetical protein
MAKLRTPCAFVLLATFYPDTFSNLWVSGITLWKTQLDLKAVVLQGVGHTFCL